MCRLFSLNGERPWTEAGPSPVNADVLLTERGGWGNPEPGLPPPGGWGLSLQRGRVCGCAPFRPPQGGHELWPHKERSRQRKAWPLQWHWPLKGLLYCSVKRERERRKLSQVTCRVRKNNNKKKHPIFITGVIWEVGTPWDQNNFVIYGKLPNKGLRLPAMCACVLSRFSHVQLFVTLWTVACQVPLSMGFFRQEYWNGLPCPPPEESSQPKDRTCISWIAGGFFTHWATWDYFYKQTSRLLRWNQQH